MSVKTNDKAHKKDPSLDEVLERFHNVNRDTLIPILQEVQHEFGYLSEDSLKKIAEYVHLPTSKVYGLATFYNQFRFAPAGKFHIQLCHGTACHMEGSVKLLDEIYKILGIRDGETARNGFFSLEVLSCIGACGQAPVIRINDYYYDRVDKKKIREIIKNLQEEIS